MVQWTLPTPNSFKLYIDGSSLGNVVYGGLIQDLLGQWILGYSSSCGIATCLPVELMAIYLGLKLAWNKGFWVLTCECDSQVALGLLFNVNIDTHLYATIFQAIREYIALDWNITFSRTWEENSRAN